MRDQIFEVPLVQLRHFYEKCYVDYVDGEKQLGKLRFEVSTRVYARMEEGYIPGCVQIMRVLHADCFRRIIVGLYPRAKTDNEYNTYRIMLEDGRVCYSATDEGTLFVVLPLNPTQYLPLILVTR